VCAAALATGFAAGLCTDAVRLVVGLTAVLAAGEEWTAEPVEGGFTPTATFTLVMPQLSSSRVCILFPANRNRNSPIGVRDGIAKPIDGVHGNVLVVGARRIAERIFFRCAAVRFMVVARVFTRIRLYLQTWIRIHVTVWKMWSGSVLDRQRYPGSRCPGQPPTAVVAIHRANDEEIESYSNLVVFRQTGEVEENGLISELPQKAPSSNRSS